MHFRIFGILIQAIFYKEAHQTNLLNIFSTRQKNFAFGQTFRRIIIRYAVAFAIEIVVMRYYFVTMWETKYYS